MLCCRSSRSLRQQTWVSGVVNGQRGTTRGVKYWTLCWDRPTVWQAEVVTGQSGGWPAALERAGLVHPRPEAVTAPLFSSGGFFLPADKVQVKYEMLRAHLADHMPVTVAAAAHGYSRAAFYLVASSFGQAGMAGLLDERRGLRGPVKLRGEIAEFDRFCACGIRGGAGRAGGGPVLGRAAPAHHRAGTRPASARCSGRLSRRRRPPTRCCGPACCRPAACPPGWPPPGSPAAGWPG